MGRSSAEVDQQQSQKSGDAIEAFPFQLLSSRCPRYVLHFGKCQSKRLRERLELALECSMLITPLRASGRAHDTASAADIIDGLLFPFFGRLDQRAIQ